MADRNLGSSLSPFILFFYTQTIQKDKLSSTQLGAQLRRPFEKSSDVNDDDNIKIVLKLYTPLLGAHTKLSSRPSDQLYHLHLP